MRNILLLIVFGGIALSLQAATVVKKKTTGHRTTGSNVHSKTTAKPSARNTKRQATKARSNKGSKNQGRRVNATSRPAPARQSQPTPDRYREIQQALADKGYLKTPPSGTWDADSQDAMRRFQADRKLEQTGKLNSLSLIGLGLGPKPADEAAATPPPTPQNH